MDGEIYHEFSSAIAGADMDVDLFGAVMLVARLGGHAVDPHRTAAELDLIAEAVREQAGENASYDALAHAIDHELFTVRSYHGNSEHHSDPQNSYLDLVVQRRTGLPITLSLVYMEVAQRVGLPCDGIGYPGHFIVRCGSPEAPIYVDPFQQGSRLDRQELLANLRSFDLRGASPESFLAAVTRRQILFRLINNLRAAFRERRDFDRWLGAVELLLRLAPWEASLLGERGMLHYRLGEPAAALADLEQYVSSEQSRPVTIGTMRLLDQLRLQCGGRGESA